MTIKKYEAEYLDTSSPNNEEARYTLGIKGAKNPLIVLGTNPNKADDEKSDNTVNRIIELIELNQDKYDGWVMINTFAMREGDSLNLPESYSLNNKLHKKNIEEIEKLVSNYETPTILLAFGDAIAKNTYLADMFLDIYNHLKGKSINWLIINPGFEPILTTMKMPRHPSPHGIGNFKVADIKLCDAMPYLEEMIIPTLQNKVKK